ncbi:hypothetical protein [Spirosoma endophyticum]|uniref:Outer membrane protein beta-barrel domain-containing protein n=1 Tax=Spirosoma endophyticum TaxID=662367 RepID=A0A1I2IEB8_9BACT|nr:hypothetical protein [Spirosoma endophyticum]SFF39437.1 hypothetical protein SAMN05216167_1643 [Spirosoma endophyticum]
MKYVIILWMFFTLSIAQGQNSSLTIGPVISYDYYATKLTNGYSSNIKSINSISYGIGLSYLKNRWLFDLKATTAERTYLLTTYVPYVPPSGENKTDRVTSRAQYYTFPLTASYRIAEANKFQLFVGAGLLTEWVPNAFKYEFLDAQGTVPPTINNPPTAIYFGGILQSTVRYYLNKSLLLQLEPTFRYLPEVQTSFGFGNRKGISALLTVAYKFN